LSIFLFFACSTVNEEDTTVRKDNPDLVYIDSIATASLRYIDSVAKVEYIKLETHQNGLLSSISKLLVGRGKIVILDDRFSQVLVFDDSGKFVGQIGAVGRGPGEFLSVEDIAFNSDTTSVFLLSVNSMKIVEYDINGKFKRDVFTNVYAYKMAVDSLDNFYLFVNKNVSDISKNYDLLKLDSDGKLLNRYFMFAGIDQPSIGFSGFVTVGRSGDVLFNNSFSDTVYAVHDDFVVPKYAFASGAPKQNLTNSEITKKLGAYNFIGFPFIELADKIVFGFNYQTTLMHSVFDRVSLEKSRLRYPLNWVSGHDADGNLYAHISPLSVENNRDKPYVQRMLKEYPLLEDVLKKSGEDDNPILIKFAL